MILSCLRTMMIRMRLATTRCYNFVQEKNTRSKGCSFKGKKQNFAVRFPSFEFQNDFSNQTRSSYTPRNVELYQNIVSLEFKIERKYGFLMFVQIPAEVSSAKVKPSQTLLTPQPDIAGTVLQCEAYAVLHELLYFKFSGKKGIAKNTRTA